MSMFYNWKNLTNINLSNLDTKNVIDMSYMFDNCENLKILQKMLLIWVFVL